MDWFILLRGIALGLLLGIMLVALLRFRAVYTMRILALFSLCLCGYLLAPLVYGAHWSFFLAAALSDATVLLFLLLAQALFDDHQRADTRSLIYGAIYLGMSYILIVREFGLGIDSEVLRIPVRIAMVAGVCYAIYRIVRNWRADLVEVRRRLRLAVCVITGAYILVIMTAESISGAAAIPLWIEIANSAGIVVSIFIFMAVALTIGAEGLLPEAARPPEPQPPHSTAGSPELEKILGAMEQDKIYRDMELTIRGLADSLGIAEHRLRKLVNQELSYRNFNDFLNHYRLQEVSGRLRDAAQGQIPVLTIAMDAGYRSMTTFNRSFRAAYGQTPTEFRRQHCPKSENS